ncbi:hypothetical protein CFB89_06590 [Burkholderia sp. AU16741]|nr:hypothetical protein CFB89_06590 [Burkholderia sp. AU16741]
MREAFAGDVQTPIPTIVADRARQVVVLVAVVAGALGDVELQVDGRCRWMWFGARACTLRPCGSMPARTERSQA